VCPAARTAIGVNMQKNATRKPIRGGKRVSFEKSHSERSGKKKKAKQWLNKLNIGGGQTQEEQRD